MDFLGMAVSGVIPTDVVTGLAFGIIRVLGYGALGIGLAGIITSCLCDLCECWKWRHDRSRTEPWQPMP